MGPVVLLRRKIPSAALFGECSSVRFDADEATFSGANAVVTSIHHVDKVEVAFEKPSADLAIRLGFPSEKHLAAGKKIPRQAISLIMNCLRRQMTPS
jgi:hypothetical protein